MIGSPVASQLPARLGVRGAGAHAREGDVGSTESVRRVVLALLAVAALGALWALTGEPMGPPADEARVEPSASVAAAPLVLR